VNSAGPLVHVELQRTADGTSLAVKLTKEESQQIALAPGALVFVDLRNLRVFAEGEGEGAGQLAEEAVPSESREPAPAVAG